MGLPWWLRWWRTCLQCRRPRFNPWVRKISWRREWLPTPVFLPGEFHGERRLVRCNPWDNKELDTTEQQILSHFHKCVYILFLYVCVCLGVCYLLRHVWLFVTQWTIAFQAPLSMRFSRQEYWSGFPFHSPYIYIYADISGASLVIEW